MTTPGRRHQGASKEQSSDCRCLFLLAAESDDAGQDVFKQVDGKLGGTSNDKLQAKQPGRGDLRGI